VIEVVEDVEVIEVVEDVDVIEVTTFPRSPGHP